MNRAAQYSSQRIRILGQLALTPLVVTLLHRIRITGILALALSLWMCQAHAAPADAGYSAAGLYNLANSYARAGKPGMAVLNYERARLLAPNDPDIEANLRFVRGAAKLPPAPPNRWERWVTVADPDALAWIGVGGVLLAGACLLVGRISARYSGLRRMLLACGIAMTALTVCNGALLWPTLHRAVVIAPSAPVRVAPVPMGDPLFVLPEAEMVTMTAEHEGFVLVRTSAGRMGWMAHADLAPILPRP